MRPYGMVFMASIYLYNKDRCLELKTPQIGEEDIKRLKSVLPPHVEGLSFSPPVKATENSTQVDFKTEQQEERVADYLKSIGSKLEQLHQVRSAVRFYDLAFRLSPRGDVLLMKARALSQHGEAEQADQLLNQCLQRDPLDPKPYLMLGKMAFGRSDYQLAKRYFEEGLKNILDKPPEQQNLKEVLSVYLEVIQIFLDRDQLFSRSLSPQDCLSEIQSLRLRARNFSNQLRRNQNTEIRGLDFYAEGLEKTFEKWIEEMKGA
jgi:tetratricopeptide (TPR) repeat protein